MKQFELKVNGQHIVNVHPDSPLLFVLSQGGLAIGTGETAITVTPAAIGNAIFDAIGGRLRHLPFTPERVDAAPWEAGRGSGLA